MKWARVLQNAETLVGSEYSEEKDLVHTEDCNTLYFLAQHNFTLATHHTDKYNETN